MVSIPREFGLLPPPLPGPSQERCSATLLEDNIKHASLRRGKADGLRNALVLSGGPDDC